ncbi:hypothetical protein A0H81_08201 [Grifola frondosa]|uniref:Uncharacterized protein n=1 Tax=Grifola frondosa TaxID=5627 RepID=A0A1C7M5Z7_GRIFR|nr:hypothetical protein A0H81_08201 [Grifola frondosa]
MSPTLASRLSFQTLTNLIPLPSLPWSPRASAVSTAAAAAAAMCFVPQSSSGSSIASDTSPKEHGQVAPAFVNNAVKATGSQSKVRGFVPKQRQLDRLRVRLEEEQRLKIKGIVSVDCKNNQDGVLHI